MMNIWFVDRIGAHSIWRLMNSIASDVIRNQGRVTYIRWDDGQQLEPLPAPEGVAIYDITVSPKRLPWDVIRQQREFCEGFAAHVSRSRPDLVHTNFCLPGSAIRRMVKQKFEIPVITTCHELFGSMNVYLRREVRRTEPFADRIVYISETVAKSYGARLDQQNRPMDPKHSIIYNGLDTHLIRSIAESADADRQQTIVSVGRLVAEKGHAQVIQAMPPLLEEFPDLSFQLIGDGPQRPQLAALAEQYEVASRVDFAGWLPYDRVLRLMANAGVVVMPSRPVQEGFGLALVEAICCGSRVVASDIPVFAEVAGKDSTSISFFRDGDISDLTHQLRDTLRATARPSAVDPAFIDTISERFSAERMTSEYLQAYAELLS